MGLFESVLYIVASFVTYTVALMPFVMAKRMYEYYKEDGDTLDLLFAIIMFILTFVIVQIGTVLFLVGVFG